MRDRIRGIFAPIPTPFNPSGAIDSHALRENVGRWSETRLAGWLALGSNGEAALLDENESDLVLEVAREATPREKVLLAGTGRESTAATVAACRRAAAHGADAVLVRPPSFFKTQMTGEALFAHFSTVADGSPAPVLLYNLPGPTGITLGVSLVARLSEHPNIIGLKETSPELERLGQFTELSGFRVLSGWAPVIYPALVAGASGGILAVANVIPNACADLFAHHQAGRHDAALESQRALTPLAQLVSSIHGVAGLKAALEQIGYHGGAVRPPLLPIPASARAEIATALARFVSPHSTSVAASRS